MPPRSPQGLGLALACLLLAACGAGGSTSGTASEPTPAPTAVDTPSPDDTPIPPTPTPSPIPGLVFGDEFDGPAGTSLDASKWHCQTGGTGFGHDLLDYKTNCSDPLAPFFTTANARTDGRGNLVLSAIREPVPWDVCWYGDCEYTSALLLTADTFRHRFGRFEIRMKTPPGRGLWPAFWMYGENADGLWGEIDLVEVIGRYPDTVFHAAHGPGFYADRVSESWYVRQGIIADEFHTYVLDWRPGVLRYVVDGIQRVEITPDSLPRGARWPFDDIDVYMVLGVSVGSKASWSGTIDARTPFPAEMLVDYVRVTELAD
ncbi:MAG: family 16 glycosylhydrolase [Alphaproteobacteria bacterium]